MKISKQARREAKALFRASFVNGVMDEAKVRTIANFIVERKPRGYIGIFSQLQRLVKLELDRRHAQIESSVALEPAQRQDIQARLATVYGQGLDYSFKENPSLLGGLSIRVGSDVYDGSIKARLAALQAAL